MTTDTQEPLRVTFEEGLALARKLDRVLVPEFGKWSVFRLTGGAGLKQRMERQRTHLSAWDALEFALGRPTAARDEAAELKKDMAAIAAFSASLREGGPVPEDLEELSDALYAVTSLAQSRLVGTEGDA